MPCPLLGVPHRICERPVRARRRPSERGRVDGRSEQRMDERDPLADPDPDEPRVLGRGERLLRHQAKVGLGERSGAQERVTRLGRQRANPRRDQRLEALGDWEPSRVPVALPFEQPGDLERVQRVPAGCLRDPHERRTRERPAELCRDDAVQGGDREWTELDPGHGAVALEPGQGAGFTRADGEDRPHPLGGQAPQRELERRRRRTIEPVEVVDGDDDGPLVGELPDEREEGGPQHPGSWRPPRLRSQQRHLERLALHVRNRRVELLRQARQQIGEPGEREPRLGLGRPRCQHRRAPGARTRDRLVPDRGLADPGLADDREDGVAIRAPLEERLDRCELGLAPDDARHAERVRPARPVPSRNRPRRSATSPASRCG